MEREEKVNVCVCVIGSETNVMKSKRVILGNN